ncbi:hypothetical protein J6590_033960 [Homalodisca vitripennis]|nr:hypothetical protein J6590_033960 [Homalodisca vitripennis]
MRLPSRRIRSTVLLDSRKANEWCLLSNNSKDLVRQRHLLTFEEFNFRAFSKSETENLNPQTSDSCPPTQGWEPSSPQKKICSYANYMI